MVGPQHSITWKVKSANSRELDSVIIIHKILHEHTRFFSSYIYFLIGFHFDTFSLWLWEYLTIFFPKNLHIIYFTFKATFVKFCVYMCVFMGSCMCKYAHVKVKGPPHRNSQDRTHIIRLGGKCHYPLSHLVTFNVYRSFKTLKHLQCTKMLIYQVVAQLTQLESTDNPGHFFCNIVFLDPWEIMIITILW